MACAIGGAAFGGVAGAFSGAIDGTVGAAVGGAIGGGGEGLRQGNKGRMLLGAIIGGSIGNVGIAPTNHPNGFDQTVPGLVGGIVGDAVAGGSLPSMGRAGVAGVAGGFAQDVANALMKPLSCGDEKPCE